MCVAHRNRYYLKKSAVLPPKSNVTVCLSLNLIPSVSKMSPPKENLAFKSRETAPSDRSNCDLAAWGARSCSCLSQRQKLSSLAEGWSCGQPLLQSHVCRSIPQPLLIPQSSGYEDPFCHARKLQPCAEWRWGNPCSLLIPWLQRLARKMQEVFY